MSPKFIRCSQEEMRQLYLEHNPFMVPNRVNVGLFAKRNGFQKMKQVIDHKQIYFYVKKED